MTDYMVRATAANDRIRAFACCTSDMVEQARRAHDTSPVATAALGRLLTGGAMMGTMMKGDHDLLTLQITGDGPIGGIVVTADSMGNAKGYVYKPHVMIHANSHGKLDVSGAIGKGTLQVIRDLGLKEPYVGSCAIQTGEIGDDLTYYFTASEQVPSAVGLGVLMERNNTVRQAGGFILQLMPDTPEEVIAALEKKLADLPQVTSLMEQGLGPEEILTELVGDLGFEITERLPVRFFCNCSEERIAAALATLKDSDLQEMIDDGETIEVKCHFCNSAYHFTVEQLKEILAARK